MHKFFRWEKDSKIYWYMAGVASVLICLSVLGYVSAHAIDSAQWEDVYDGTVSSAYYSSAPRQSWHFANCSEEQATLETYGRTIATTLCVVHGMNISLASYSSGGDAVQYALKKPEDTAYHLLTNVYAPAQPVLLSDDTLLTVSLAGPNNMQMVVLNNVGSKVQDQATFVGPGYNKIYTVDVSQGTPVQDMSGGNIYVRHIAASQNNKYASVEVYGAGVAIVDLVTHKARLLSNDKVSDYSSYGGSIRLAASNDGKKVFVVGDKVDVDKMYIIDDFCGSASFQSISKIDRPCDWIDLKDRMKASLEGRTPYYIEFNQDSREANVYAWSLGDVNSTKVTVRPDPNSMRLEYLALGDSYSSGEGDTEKDSHGDKYYRLFTDREESRAQGIPQNKCHISTRSYPYVLAKGMDLGLDSPKQWDTIACNGATAWDVKDQGSDEYLGRGNSLAGFDATALKTQALNEMIPGRQKQVEFVKKYKPRTITLTMGGNDVGFGDRIRSCATPFTTTPTCSIATEEGRPGLGIQIRNQYDNLKSLYNELRMVSADRAKIYVLGYPQFMNGDEPASCGANIGALNNTERQVISQSVSYINSVVRQATKAAGVKYIDTENSLSGGRLCDGGQKYVTGVSVGDLQESFHPNAKGHFRIAMSVWDSTDTESLLSYDTCPGTAENSCPDANATKEKIQTPAYFSGTSQQPDTHYQQMTASEQRKTSIMDIIIAPTTFLKNSIVNIVMHSDPIELGSFQAGDDGSLNVDAILPELLPAGYHTLIATGYSPDNRPIRYEQVVLVTGADPNDADENGVADTQQKCGAFMSASGVDSDLDGIDDACDPEVTAESPGSSPSPTPSPTSSVTPTPQPSGQNPVAVVIIQIVNVIVAVVKMIVRAIMSLRFW